MGMCNKGGLSSWIRWNLLSHTWRRAMARTRFWSMPTMLSRRARYTAFWAATVQVRLHCSTVSTAISNTAEDWNLLTYKKGKTFIKNRNKLHLTNLFPHKKKFHRKSLRKFIKKSNRKFRKRFLKKSIKMDYMMIPKDTRDRLMKDYSHGTRNKMQMLINIIAKPRLMLLDEPLTSLDVVVAEEMKDILRSQKDGRVLIFSTHLLDIALDLCDEIVLLNHGRLEKVDKADLDNSDFKTKIIEALRDAEDV